MFEINSTGGGIEEKAKDMNAMRRCIPVVEKGKYPVLFLYSYCARGHRTSTHEWCLYATPMIRVPLFLAGHTFVT